MMFTIARFTLLEARRNHLFVVAAAGAACLYAIGEFVGAISVTEARQIQSALTASLLRVASIALLSVFVITSALRELNDKSLELLLSLHRPRHWHFLGKFSGYAGLALALSLILSLPLFNHAPALPALCWLLSLVCEQTLVIAFSLLCLWTCANATVAFGMTAAFYLLCRGMETARLLSQSPLLDGSAAPVLRGLVEAIALLLPDLSAFTRSDWLVYETGFVNLGPVLIQTAIYLPLLLSAGLLDFHRKSL